ncbi:unnamed protein product [Peniophora sp. CBMAI 1063]|nr:unnamed protein product [Peniophora sp. CBMAI 1063]
MDPVPQASSVQPRRVAFKVAILNSGFLMTPEHLEVICVCHEVPERKTKGALRAFNDYLLSKPETKGLVVTTTRSRNYVFIQTTAVVFEQEVYNRVVGSLLARGHKQYFQRLTPWVTRTIMENHPRIFNVDKIFNSDAESDVEDDSEDLDHFDPADVPWVVRAWDNLSSKPLPDNIKASVERLCKAQWRKLKGQPPAPSSVDMRHGQVFEMEMSEEDQVLLHADMPGTVSNTPNSSTAVKNSA